MSDTVWLCFTRDERPTLRAVYNNDAQAFAWKEGVEAGYAGATVISFPSNGGKFDFSEESKLQGADHD